MKNILISYFEEYTKLAFHKSIYQTIEVFQFLALKLQSADTKLIFEGNGVITAKALDLQAVTFTGRNANSSLKYHDDINFFG